MSLSFDDDRLPTEPFNVLCPRCRQSVTIMPPPKEEPRLPGTAGVLDAVATGSQAEKDPIAALAELLLSNLKLTQPQSSDANKWQRRRVLLCLDDAASRERLRSALDPDLLRNLFSRPRTGSNRDTSRLAHRGDRAQPRL